MASIEQRFLGSVKFFQIIYIIGYFLAKINKIFEGIATPISKKSYNLQQKRAKIRLFEKSSLNLRIILSFFCLIYLSGCQSVTNEPSITKPQSPKQEIEIAILMPTTGGDGELGKQYKDLIKMGLSDGIKSYIHVTSYDGSDEKNILAAMDKIVKRKTKIILGPLYSNFTSLIAEQARANDIIIITMSNNPALAEDKLLVFGHAPLKQLIRIINYFGDNNYKDFMVLLPEGKHSQTVHQVIQNILIQKSATLVRTAFYSETPESIEKAAEIISDNVDIINEKEDTAKPVIYLSDDPKNLNLVANSIRKHNLDKKAILIGDNRIDIDYQENININFTGSLNILNSDVPERAKELGINHISFMHALAYDLGKMTASYIGEEFALEKFLNRIKSRQPYIGLSGNIHFVDSIAQRQYDIIRKEDGVYSTLSSGR
ncbi:penicillin-binding protein activator [Rickettsia endosymbiont of Halotydeus destructor]|uniref:penicillin-binding protein activator n=1 Tax=Rickettsia endosymbiont of Halotydeus destructor TaxID=2996754 RepID=UPI003BB096F1